jgi:hypothetical protein
MSGPSVWTGEHQGRSPRRRGEVCPVHRDGRPIMDQSRPEYVRLIVMDTRSAEDGRGRPRRAKYVRFVARGRRSAQVVRGAHRDGKYVQFIGIAAGRSDGIRALGGPGVAASGDQTGTPDQVCPVRREQATSRHRRGVSQILQAARTARSRLRKAATASALALAVTTMGLLTGPVARRGAAAARPACPRGTRGGLRSARHARPGR